MNKYTCASLFCIVGSATLVGSNLSTTKSSILIPFQSKAFLDLTNLKRSVQHSEKYQNFQFELLIVQKYHTYHKC